MTDQDWRYWLVATRRQLVADRKDPSERIEHCGHRHALSLRWSRTVGLWGGVHPPQVIIDVAETTRTAYENFKYRHRLVTCGHSDPMPEHEVSLLAYMAVEGKLVATAASPGQAAQAASKIVGPGNPGMLPIELLVRWANLKAVLEVEDLDMVRWSALSPAAQELAYARTAEPW